MRYAYFKGNYVDEDLAVVSIRTHSFNYGTAAFEGIRAYFLEDQKARNIFRPADHYKRLKNSASILGFKLPVSENEFENILTTLLQKNRIMSDIYFRPLLYADRLGVGVSKATGVSLAVYMEALPRTSIKSLRCCIVDTVKTPSSSIPAIGKLVGSYINSFLAQSEAVKKGYDIALLKNISGNISEAFGMTVFAVKNKQILTPPVVDDVLEGLTRKSLIYLAKKYLGITVAEQHISPDSLMSSDEVFLCGTGSMVNAVTSIENNIIGGGNVGVITKSLGENYQNVVIGRLPESEKWCITVSER